MVDLEDYFCALVSGHDVQRGKPFPDVYLEASSQMGLSSNECLVIEDSPSGLMGGFQAGCQTIYIPDLFELSQQERKNVNYCCDSLLDVIEIIKKKDR
jgi:beta-phosphoglucomutase-like phosphatase (HAD superfamily)